MSTREFRGPCEFIRRKTYLGLFLCTRTVPCGGVTYLHASRRVHAVCETPSFLSTLRMLFFFTLFLHLMAYVTCAHLANHLGPSCGAVFGKDGIEVCRSSRDRESTHEKTHVPISLFSIVRKRASQERVCTAVSRNTQQQLTLTTHSRQNPWCQNVLFVIHPEKEQLLSFWPAYGRCPTRDISMGELFGSKGISPKLDVQRWRW